MSDVSFEMTAIEKKNSASRPESAPMPTAETNSSAHKRSGSDRMTELSRRSPERTIRLGAP